MKATFKSWLMILVMMPVASWSHQVITFTDGTKVTAFITYSTKDTVKYYLKTNPEVKEVMVVYRF
jgi:hypothetical protein